MSSTTPIGTHGSVPEATSVLLFVLVLGLIWFAMLKTGQETFAAESIRGPLNSMEPAEARGASLARPDHATQQ